jgi:plastocyanin
MNKKILILLIVFIILGVGFYTYNKKEAQAPTNNTPIGQQGPQGGANPHSNTPSTTPIPSPTPNTQTNVKGNTGPDYTPGAYSGGGETTGLDMQVVEVDFDGTSFTPKVTDIKQNDYVFFKNKSKVNFFPASNPYPADSDYPAFKAAKAIAPGAQFKFQFTKVGSWGYHDDLHPSIGGTVNVSK